MAIGQPLTDQDYEGIKEQLANLDALDVELKKAHSAGVDVSQQKEEARKSREQLIKIKQTYFPNRS